MQLNRKSDSFIHSIHSMDRIHSIEFRIQTLFSVIIQLLVCILTIISMVYQLTFVKNTFFITTSNGTTSNETIIDPYLQKPRDNLVYIGLVKDEKIGLYLKVNRTTKQKVIFF
jgi:hypothetical protein